MMMMSCMEVCNNTHTKTMVIVQLRFQWNSRQKKQPCTYIIRTVCMHVVLHTHTQSRTQRHILHAHTIFTHHHKITWSLFIVKPRITWAGCHCNNTRIGKKRKLKRTNRIKIAIVHIAIYWLCCFALLCFIRLVPYVLFIRVAAAITVTVTVAVCVTFFPAHRLFHLISTVVCAKIYYVKISRLGPLLACCAARHLHNRTLFVILETIACKRKCFRFVATKLAFFLFASFLFFEFHFSSTLIRQRTCIYFTNFSLTALWCAPFFVLLAKPRAADMVWHGMAWHWNLFATKIKLFNGIFRTAWNECSAYRIYIIIQTHTMPISYICR